MPSPDKAILLTTETMWSQKSTAIQHCSTSFGIKIPSQRHNPTAITAARNAVIADLHANTAITPASLSNTMTAAFGGSDASGAWHWRMAYDVMQSAVLCVVREQLRSVDHVDPTAGLEIINRVICLLPTQTRRSERQMQLQQFSTALDWAWVAASAADVQPNDVILEPSAGTGCLAGLAAVQDASAKLALNELDPLRRALLGIGFGGQPSGHDAEFIDDLLDPAIKPSLILMNPPFASSSARSSDPSIAIRHMISAAKRLAVGGRLVAIVPPNVRGTRQADLWARLCKLVTPQLRLELPRTAFRRQGTSVETHMIVAERHDGAGGNGGPCKTLAVGAPQVALKAVTEHLPPRTQITSNALRPRAVPISRATSSSAARLQRFHETVIQTSVQNPVRSRWLGRALKKPEKAQGERQRFGRVCEAKPERTGNLNSVERGNVLKRNASAQKKGFLTPKRAMNSDALDPITAALAPLVITGLNKPRINEAVSDVYARYKPQRMEIAGAQDHPTPLVESLAMASVAPPLPDTDAIDLRLPANVVTQGLLSEAQLETLAMAESAFAMDLPGRFKLDEDDVLVRDDDGDNTVAYRKGYFLGDGTGCGKGRQVAGAILAGWSAGRRKAVWVSKSATLIEDAKRDWADLGGAPTNIHALSLWSGDEDIRLKQGILFVTYVCDFARDQPEGAQPIGSSTCLARGWVRRCDRV